MSGANPPAGAGLRLRAEDGEDLAVISACLQDALVAVRDLAYDQGAKTFILVANRFCWEGCGVDPKADGRFERTLCGVRVEQVDSVAYRGFHRSQQNRILELLAIRAVPRFGGDRAAAAESRGSAIDLEFAGAARIRLAASVIRVRARDFGEPWPTTWQPTHALDTTE